MKQISCAAKIVQKILHQECESSHIRLSQALGNFGHDQIEGIRGYRRAVKKIRCALLLTAGSLSAHERQKLDEQWVGLGRRLGYLRDMHAREKKIYEIILSLPVAVQSEALQALRNICGSVDNETNTAHRREVLGSLTGDTERLICITQSIGISNLTPTMVAGSVEHLWNRAHMRAQKSWDGRNEIWLHALRKRVQRTHIAFRILRAQSGPRGLEIEKRLDAAAKAMGELRDISLLRTQCVAAPEFLHAHILQTEIESTNNARRLVTQAFKFNIAKALRFITVSMHSA